MTSSVVFSKIFSLVNAWNNRPALAVDSGADQGHEQRREFRRESNERLFLQIVQAKELDMIGTTISCKALNVSASGMMVACDQAIPAGSFIDLWVDDSERAGKFFLSSEVKWASENQPGEYQIGVLLLDGAATDIAEWRERQS